MNNKDDFYTNGFWDVKVHPITGIPKGSQRKKEKYRHKDTESFSELLIRK